MARSRSIRAGRAYVELGVEDRLTRGLRTAQRRLQDFGRSVQRIGMGLAGVGAAIIAPLAGASRVFARVGDDLDKLSRRTGIGVESLQELGFAAELSGSNIEQMEAVLRRMFRTIIDAERGLSSAVDGLTELGLTYRDLRGLAPEDQFFRIAERIAAIEDVSRRAGVAQMVFGRSAAQLLPMMDEGARGIAEMRDRFRELNLTVSQADAELAKNFVDRLTELRMVVRRIVIEFGAGVAEVIKPLVRDTSDALANVVKLVEQNRQMVAVLVAAGAVVLTAAAAFLVFGIAVQGVAFAIGGLATVTALAVKAVMAIAVAAKAVGAKVGIAGAALVGFGARVVHEANAGARAVEWLGEKFDQLRGRAVRAIGAIGDALAAGDIALAGRILWLTLRQEWQRGVQFLQRRWLDFKFGFLETFNDAVAGVQSAWTGLVAFLRRSWSRFTAQWQRMTERAAFTFTYAWIEVKAAIDDTFDREFALQYYRQQRGRRMAEIDRDEAKALAQVDADREQRMQKIVSDHATALSGLRHQHDAELAKTGSALEKARKEWEQAIDQARRARATGEGGVSDTMRAMLMSQLDGLNLPQIPGVGGGADHVVGTFSPALLERLGFGREPDERTAKATEQAARYLRRMLQQLEDGTAVFG